MSDRSLYPLRDLPKQRQIWSWISYDVANQSFTLIINTLLFSIFFGKVVVQDDTKDDTLWAIGFGGSMLLAAILSPIFGAAADERGWKKSGLIVTGTICGVFTCLLALIQPGQIWLALLLYIPANCAFALGENFLASFLPALASEKDIGRLSGFSWGLAYLAALLLLALTAGSMLLFKVESVENWRPYFVFAGLWFLAFMIPTIRGLKEPAITQVEHPGRNFVVDGFQRLAESIRHLKGYRDLGLLMLASFFYGTGMSVVVSFASKLAEEYGFDQVKLVLFLAVITVSGIIGTFIPMKFQDRIGHRRITVMLLFVWILAATGFAAYAYLHDSHTAAGGTDYPTWPLWIIGNLLGFGLGSLGSANRAFVGYLSPPEKAAEMFGVWGFMFKLAAVMTIPFAWMKDKSGTPPALLLLAGFIIIGIVFTLMVDEKRGYAAAQRGSK
ncbi:MFS transporter [Luteolibacter flavescens]|uniref:MFS transporter n=1 Tax=Luteolibacter flavescens TaxID=1859460 RepID=A0ABT3FJM2_9BACT|nr:MFS transporter [Luteolibacter flavescens]MCW1883414.1 MFS transporter [Luteolibacter flavescens]